MKQAPDFNLPDQNGKMHGLKDYKGQWVILYFYPRDNTPACTTEACGFRDAGDAIAELGKVKVIGISKDSVKLHKKFSDNNSLNFTLLSDVTHETIAKYGAWQPKKFMGREYMGIMRNTYIINPDGEIVKTYEGINPKTHVSEILKDLAELKN